MEEIAPFLRATVDAGGEFCLIIRGTSMKPLLVSGIDTAVLVHADGVRVNDCVLYTRANGQFVLHRAVAVDEKAGTFDACGDNQIDIERGIPIANIEARMTAIIRANGRREDLGGNEEARYLRGALARHKLYIHVRCFGGRILRALHLKK